MILLYLVCDGVDPSIRALLVSELDIKKWDLRRWVNSQLDSEHQDVLLHDRTKLLHTKLRKIICLFVRHAIFQNCFDLPSSVVAELFGQIDLKNNRIVVLIAIYDAGLRTILYFLTHTRDFHLVELISELLLEC